jgi:hypothetical protein
MARLRTKIAIDDVYVRRITDRYGGSWIATVYTPGPRPLTSLRHLAGLPVTREEALAIEGAHAIDQFPSESAPPS